MLLIKPPEPYVPPPVIYRTVRNRLGIMQNPTGFHEGQRVWGGGIVKYRNGSDQWYAWEFDTDDGQKRPGGVHSSQKTNHDEHEGIKGDNIHTGATPPWLVADDSEAKEAPVIGPSFGDFQKYVETSKKRSRNPERVGANFDRHTNVDNEWLPSFGGVWNAGPRWQTRRNFKSRRQRK